jgi:hypothetical protein
MPASVLVRVECFTMSIVDLTLQLLDSQLNHTDAIRHYDALGEHATYLYLVGLAQETQLVFH